MGKIAINFRSVNNKLNGNRQMQNIKLELPLDGKILANAADFLQKCAIDLGATPLPASVKADNDDDQGSVFDELQYCDDCGQDLAADLHQNCLSDSGDSSQTDNSDDDEQQNVGEFDMPWDKRIHSSGQTKYKTGPNAGQWITKRGVTLEDRQAIEAELLAAWQQGGGQPTNQGGDNTQDDNSQNQNQDNGGGDDAAAQAFSNNNQNQNNNQGNNNPPADLEQVLNFPALMALINRLKGGGSVTDESLNKTCLEVAGVDSVALMATKPDMISAVGYAIQAL